MKLQMKEINLSVEVNSIHISYNDMGAGSVPVIFIHGFPFDKSMWDRQLDALKTTHRVIAYDIRGFGRSTDEESALNIDLFADDLIQFMDKLDIDKAIVCGLSMGGYIALNAQKRFPDRIAALVLCDTQCIADTPAAKEKRLKSIDEIKEDGVTDFNERFIRNVFHKDSLLHKKDIVENLKKVVYTNSQHIITQGLTALAARSETCSTLNKVNIPTLIICGSDDVLTPPEQSEYVHKHIKGSEFHIIENAGHVSNLEQPDEFNKYLIKFLSHL
jgi:pimeloyl-ACP methyl ester carboxylesterase